MNRSPQLAVLALLTSITFTQLAHAAELTASDGATNAYFGYSASLSGNTGLVGAYGSNASQGAAYLYRSLDTASGMVTQNVKLTASDGVGGDLFGYSVSLSGNTGLVGAAYATIGSHLSQGAAYLYRSLDTASGTVTQNVKLTASDGAENDSFGFAVSLSGNTGLVGASAATIGSNTSQGAAYVYRSLDTASGTITQNVKLTASDGAVNAFFGSAVSLSGNTALVGAYKAKIGNNSSQGAAYLYRNLDTASGAVTQDVKLTASDGAINASFGYSVSLSGNAALVGAYGSNLSQGAAYLYRNLYTASGTVTQDVKLTASDGVTGGDRFGSSVSLDGDTFIVGAYFANSHTGRAYTGSVSSMTTLDEGNASRVISGISFVSQGNWIIGQATDANKVTLSHGDSATVTASGMLIAIGQEAGSDGNLLDIAGHLVATTVAIGSTSGNTGNTLRLEDTATFTVGSMELADGNILSIEGDYTDATELFGYLGSTSLQIWDGSWTTLTADNASSLITSEFSDGYTTIQAVPEPGTWELIGSGAIVLLFFCRRKKSAQTA